VADQKDSKNSAEETGLFKSVQATSKKRITTLSGWRAPVPRKKRSVIQPSTVEAVSKLGLQRK
jgi:hypothetical protein